MPVWLGYRPSRQCRRLHKAMCREGIASLDAAPAVQATGVAERRELLCAQLGLGSVSSKALQRQLNMFGFTLAEVEAALAWLQPEA